MIDYKLGKIEFEEGKTSRLNPATPVGWFCPACGAHHSPSVETCPFGSTGWLRPRDIDLVDLRTGKRIKPKGG
jgi:hypothetical protein